MPTGYGAVVRINCSALRALREKDGLSTYSLAAASGVSQTQVSALEQPTDDGDPRVVWPSTAKALADALRVPMSAITLVDDTEAAAS